MTNIHTKNYDQFVESLRLLRKKLKISQKELADRLNKHQSFISKYETKERRLDVVETIEICEALNSNPGEFFSNLVREISSPQYLTKKRKTRTKVKNS